MSTSSAPTTMSQATYHLRPVSPSPSPTASTTSPSTHSPPSKRPSPPTSTSSTGRPRRPLSPSSLRDLDLSHSPDMPARKYAAPLTGHDLMAMFPPAPPDNFPELRAGPTSGYFQRQERAFFAQAGKEIVRVRVEVDLQSGVEQDPISGKLRAGAPRSWPLSSHPQPPSGPHHSPVQPSSTAPVPYPLPSSSRPTHRPVTSGPLFPIIHSPASQLPPNLHPPVSQQPGIGLRTPPQEVTSSSGVPITKPEHQADDYDDESWRRPMPYAERRRAGKHTKRVIVRN